MRTAIHVVAALGLAVVAACGDSDETSSTQVTNEPTPATTEPPVITEGTETTELPTIPENASTTDPPPASEDASTTDPPSASEDAKTPELPATTQVVATTEPPPPTETTDTVPPRADALELRFVGCDRFGFFAQVEPEVARNHVPESYELWLVDEHARFALQTLSCDDLLADGVSHGPGNFGTAWIRIVGPEAAVTLPSQSDLVAQPTDSFHPPLIQTDNVDFHAAVADGFGIPMTLADSMTSDPPTEGTQTGQVIDLDHDPLLSYRWTVDNVNWRDETPMGRHNLFGLDDQGAPLTYYGEFLHEPGWRGNVGTVELEPGSAFEDLIGTTATGPVNGDPVTIDMIVFRDEG